MVTKQEAARFLGSVPGDKAFWLHNGPVLHNLESLAAELGKMSDAAYKYHMNREKKDFGNWINEIIGDKKLANELMNAKNRPSAMKKVQARVNFLKKRLSD